MRISLDWISDYVDLTGLDPKTIADRLTLATAEVEEVHELHRYVRGVVLGKVVACERLDDKRTFCTVDCGSKTYTTVCGAPNARVGLVAPFAPAGTRLAGDVTIEQAVVAGKVSEGILCSAAELGLSAWHEAVFECPANTPPGLALIELVPEHDTLIEIDNKSLTHRPDLWGHYGFAREFAAVFGRPLKALPLHDTTPYDALPVYPIHIDDPENCPCYGCIEFEANLLEPAPVFMQRRLHALGQRTYNMGIDATNYVNWEIAQPTHAFDADLIGEIRIGPMGMNGTFQTLDGQERRILPEDMMIWGSVVTSSVVQSGMVQSDMDKSGVDRRLKPVALAGIMGGLETEVSEATKKLLLESANFRAQRIRKTSTRLDLRTDASQRYEKSQPPSNVKLGIQRILKLFEVAGIPFQVLSRLTIQGDLQDQVRTVVLEEGRLERLSGISLPPENVLGILHALGFQAEYRKEGNRGDLVVGVPPHRSAKDIAIPEDILEEVLRIHGFGNIPPVMPEMPLAPLFIEKHIKLEHRARRLLAAGHRFLEIHNYCWMSDPWLQTLGFEPGETLVLRNPVTPWETRLRTTLIPNLLALVPKNRPHRDQFRLFEIGKAYFPAGKAGSECDERTRLSGISFRQSGGSPEEHYLEIKAAIEDIGALFHRPFRFVAGTTTPTPWQSADHWVEIQQRNPDATYHTVGAMGVLDKSRTKAVSPEGGGIVWFELEMDKIDGDLFPVIAFKEPARFPGSWQDFSLVWELDRGFEQLEKTLDGFTHPLLKKREFLVVYKGKGLKQGTASYSFRFWIGADDHTLDGGELDAFHKAFLDFINDNGISLRG
ncbi:MAG TPA: hypothetical protein DEB39_04135 [Planctomycetaceae bacterium]|nr:hypothetical protein [Planctomycetaceae bacterium]